MATLAAQVGPTGIIAPSYADIYAQLQFAFWSIYGSDADLAPDSQDGQFLAILAQAIYDGNQLAIAIFNSFAPAYAQGAGLSSLVKINGIARLVPTNSQAVVNIGGQVGTIITNGIIGDNLGLNTRWLLPATVTIPLSGEIDVTAICTQPGAITAAADSLSEILTPTRGWQTASNALPAIPGQPVESDAQLRQRQALSTSLPALSTLQSIYAGLANLDGVTRLQVYENDTDVVNGDGIPAHSISAVVGGGDVQEIAAEIAHRKSPGTGTYGTTTEVVVDTHGVPDTIHFFALDEVTVLVEVTIAPLNGYVSTTGETLRQAVAEFVSGLAIGEDSYLARLYSPANLGGVGLGATFVVTAIRQARDGNPLSAANVTIAFNEAALCLLENVTLIET